VSLGKLISSLLEDSKKYLILARDCERKQQKEFMLSYCRAVFFGSWSALEGWINYIAYSFVNTDHSLNQYEIALLTEKRIEVDDDGKIQITKQDEYRSTLKKLLFVFRRFGNDFDLKHNQADLWRRLREIEHIRNLIVHPKDTEHDIPISLKEAEKCYDTVQTTIDLLKEKIYG
jgi:hypothetical protein